MSDLVRQAVASLDRFRTKLAEHALPRPSELLSDQFPNAPGLRLSDIVEMFDVATARIARLDDVILDSDLKELMIQVEPRAAAAQECIAKIVRLPQSPSSSTPAFSIYSILAFHSWLTTLVAPTTDWDAVENEKLLPAKIHRRLNSLNKRIEQFEADESLLNDKVVRINDAAEAAEDLPETLASLKNSRAIALDATKNIDEWAALSKSSFEKIIALEADLNHHSERAKSIIEECDNALGSSTSAALAASFKERALALKKDGELWVTYLAIALVLGGVIAAIRIWLLQDVLTSEPRWGVVLMHVTLSALALGGPLWFAWIATRQVSYLFKLAEDYSYKSAVATAYEGYRKQAMQLNPDFVSRLFSSALNRLDEPPLRVMDSPVDGSPYQEFLRSSVAKEAFEKVPQLKSEFYRVFGIRGGKEIGGGGEGGASPHSKE